MPFEDNEPFEEKVKCLADEELLEIWAESQRIECMLSADFPGSQMSGPNYEKVIIHELTMRKTRQLAAKH